MAEGSRRLAAIMFTDMVGYTALSQRDEALSLALVQEQKNLLRPIILRHGGKEVKMLGDGFLVEFPNALEAVRCAYDIQESTRDHNKPLPDERKIHLRVGLHIGDVVELDGDVYGDAVNIASRIESLAEDGGVCLTKTVYESTRNKFELPCVSLGLKTLKNVIEPVEVYRMELPWARPTPKTSTSTMKRIAVLPFANMSPDPGDEYFADGMTDEIISALSRLEQVEVISRTSVMQYRKNPKSIREVSTELNVSTILEGSVRKAGDRLRITAQLIDAERDRHIWAESYDRKLEDVFAVQSEVAQSVSDALRVRLHETDEPNQPKTDIRSYTMFLRARQLWQSGTEANCREAIALLKAALSKDPKFARAYSALAEIWIDMTPWEDFATCVDRAEDAVRQASELAPEKAETHTAMAKVDVAVDRFEEALVELKRATSINSSLAEAYRQLGWVYSVLGRFDEGISNLDRALVLDPLDPKPALTLIPVLRVTGRVADALALVERTKEVYGRAPAIYHLEAICYLQAGRYAEALRSVESGLNLAPGDHWLRVVHGTAKAMSGERDTAAQELLDLIEDYAESHRLDAQVWIGTQLGDVEGAFRALMRQAELHSWWGLVGFDPIFERLQAHPLFPEFCRKAGLPSPSTTKLQQ